MRCDSVSQKGMGESDWNKNGGWDTEREGNGGEKMNSSSGISLLRLSKGSVTY